MPLIGQAFSTPTPRLGVSLNGMQMQKAVDYTVTQDRSAPLVIGGVGALGALDLADTVSSSIPGLSSALGIERGDVNRAALQAIDMPGLGDFYHDYKGGIEATSGIMGMVAADLVTRKLTAPTTAFMGLMRTLPYARRVAALDRSYEIAL